MRLKDKVAIVTGANSGIGRAVAEKFVSEGAKVVFSDINGDESSVSEFGEAAIFVRCDVTKSKEVDELVGVHHIGVVPNPRDKLLVYTRSVCIDRQSLAGVVLLDEAIDA